jgi:DnaJ-class molecular chaperone
MSDQDNTTEPDGQEAEPTACMPCRGTGKVISNLGGAPSMVVCPWCSGGGMRIPDKDAQSAWLGATDGGAQAPAADLPD